MNMKTMWNNKYYKRIFGFMLAFTLVLVVPFSIISYQISKRNILKSIDDTNNTIFSQLNYSFSMFSDRVANVCMELYLNNDMQQVLYNKNASYNDILTCLTRLGNTTLVTNTSIESVTFYNHARKEWYSTDYTKDNMGQELTEYLDNQTAVPKLTPLLRKVTNNRGNIETSSYVFSYFMYQYADPATGNDSYLMVDESANWFVDNMVSIQQNLNFSQSIFLTNNQGVLYGSRDQLSDEAEQYLIQDFWQGHAGTETEKSNYYLVKYNGIRYMVSSIPLDSQPSFLVIVRNYNDVFADLINLQRDFAIFGVLFFMVGIVLLGLFSRRIYYPVHRLISNISEGGSPSGVSANAVNEFEYLRNVLDNSNELNQKLLIRSETHEPMVEQYQLLNLISHSTTENYERFKKVIPNHWLLELPAPSFCIMLIEIDRFSSNQFHFESTDMHLLSFAVQNIVLELFNDEFVLSHFNYDMKSSCMVIATGNTCKTAYALLPYIEKIQVSVKKHLDITVSISYSSVSQRILDLEELMKEAKEYLQYRYLLGPSRVLDKAHCIFNLQNQLTSYDNQLNEQLHADLYSVNMPALRVTLFRIANALQSFRYENANVCIYTLVNRLAARLNQLYRDGEISIRPGIDALYRTATNSEFVDDCFEGIYQVLVKIYAGVVEPAIVDKDTETIQLIVEFVESSYKNPELTSAMIGDHLGLSKRYIMYKFKEATGTSLGEYLTSVRLRKASDLLKNTNFPINKVAENVGIENNSYFYKIFKKAYKCTPREFTDQYHTEK